MEVISESSVKNGVATPDEKRTASHVAATPEQLAHQLTTLKDLWQEWTVSARATGAVIIQFSVSFVAFEDETAFAKNAKARQDFAHAFPTITKDVAKRYRAIAAVATSLKEVQHALPPTRECITEVARAFAPGKDAEKQRVLAAVKNGTLTPQSSLADIRDLRNDIAVMNPAERTAARITRKERRAAPAPAVIDVTPSSRIAADAPSPLNPDAMMFSDIVVKGNTITGRFTIKNIQKRNGAWPTFLPATLVKALADAGL